MECHLCKQTMKKINSINSCNSVFEELECKECSIRKTICTGVST